MKSILLLEDDENLNKGICLKLEKEHMFNITNYHYPVMGALVVTLVLFAVQFLLTLALSKSTKKESVIERIRFSE